MNDDLPTLHNAANNALVRLLSERVRDMRSGVSDISPPAKALPGIAPVPTNEARQINAPSDSGRSKGPIA